MILESCSRGLFLSLFNALDAKKWSNILALVELLPMSNGKVERMFSLKYKN